MIWLRRFRTWSEWLPATGSSTITGRRDCWRVRMRERDNWNARISFSRRSRRQISTTPETLFNYASFLKTANRREEAREWLQKLLAKKRTLPRYMQRRERPWFRRGKALLKELASA